MEFRTLLGFLGLLGLLVLLLIYILKPNYQTKVVSSTYMWKLSLKYNKQKLPVGKIRNLLVIICQSLIIVACGFMLAQPFVAQALAENQTEKIIVIDAGAGMMANDGENGTRFERAVARAKEEAHDALKEEGGIVSVILAGTEAGYLKYRLSDTENPADIDPQLLNFVANRTSSQLLLDAALDSLVRRNDLGCTYGSADVDGAMILAEEVLDISPGVEVILFTATKYTETDKTEYVVNGVTVKDVSGKEWNAAILDVVPHLHEDGYFVFDIDVASYNMNMNLVVNFSAQGLNWDTDLRVDTLSEIILVDSVQARISLDRFDSLVGESNKNGRIYSYDTVRVWIDYADSFTLDNDFRLFGGVKPTIKVLYVSTIPDTHPNPNVHGQPAHNNFFSAILRALRQQLINRWNIELSFESKPDELELKGYDFYIFEHVMPRNIPVDGVVFIMSPDTSPGNSGVIFGDWIVSNDMNNRDADFRPLAAESSPLLNNVNPENIGVSAYRSVAITDESYKPLMVIEDIENGTLNPVLLLKEDQNQKVMIMPFGLNYSTFALIPEFSFFLYNIFEYFFPPTITQYVYDVGEEIALNARGSEITIAGQGISEVIDTLPNIFVAKMRGLYNLVQTPFGREVSERIWVRIPKSESTFNRVDLLYIPKTNDPKGMDWNLLVYFAAALVALLVVERILHIRGNQIL